jgi:hypothetical protein
MRQKRSLSAQELLNMRFKVMDFDGEFLKLFGKPEMSGCWIIWGESVNGKTSLMLQLCKYLTRFGRVVVDSIEEGYSQSLKIACIDHGMTECGSRFQVLHKESLEDLEIRLGKRKGPDIIIIDSIQYTDLTKKTAKEFIDRWPKKLFIFVSHAKGKLPEGHTANKVRYHSNVKIRVEGYRAKIESRYGGDKSLYYTIWYEGAKEYWGDIL